MPKSWSLDPYEVVFMGVEGGGWRFDTDIETWYDAVDENGKPYTSFAIWGSDWYHEQFHKPNGRYQVGYQWEAEERERMYYTSATENAGEYSTGTVQRDDISYDSTINFQGFSKYVVEKSVIHGTSFASDFNNGHGMQYFVNGQVSRDMEWTNLNLQDILPTWQWWITSTDDNRLELDWDYGSKFYRYDSNGETYAFPYTQIGAYNGGSSLVMYGDLLGSQTVNLYKNRAGCHRLQQAAAYLQQAQRRRHLQAPSCHCPEGRGRPASRRFTCPLRTPARRLTAGPRPPWI